MNIFVSKKFMLYTGFFNMRRAFALISYVSNFWSSFRVKTTC